MKGAEIEKLAHGFAKRKLRGATTARYGRGHSRGRIGERNVARCTLEPPRHFDFMKTILLLAVAALGFILAACETEERAVTTTTTTETRTVRAPAEATTTTVRSY